MRQGQGQERKSEGRSSVLQLGQQLPLPLLLLPPLLLLLRLLLLLMREEGRLGRG